MRRSEGERSAVDLFDDFPWEPERRDRTPLLPAADVFAAFEWRDEEVDGDEVDGEAAGERAGG